MIKNFYTTKFSNNRMVWYEESAELNDSLDFYGHIQQTSAQLTQSLGLTFTKAYTIWCPLNTDIIVGDVIEADGISYNVKAIKDLLVGVNKHKQVFVEKQQQYG